MKTIILAIAIFLAGCAAPVSRVASTPSGRPEVQIKGVDLDSVRARLIEKTMAAGFSLDADAPGRIVISKEMQGMQEALMRMMISNASSTPVRAETTLTLVKNAEGVHIYAQSVATSTMPFGQVKRHPMEDNNSFNVMQDSLTRLRDSFPNQ